MRARRAMVRRPLVKTGFCAAAVLTFAAGCARQISPLVAAGESAVALTAGPNSSAIYLARTSAGVIAIDLGWWGYREPLADALGKLAATPKDVVTVFLTHSHRDHIAAWPVVSHARFVTAAAERERLVGTESHRGAIPRWADRIKPSHLPREAELDLHTFTADTAFVIGGDTLRAYVVAGHTAGSAAYLFRGILFLGDAVTYSRLRGFMPGRSMFSDDRTTTVRSLRRLWTRLPPGGVRHVCTAHARCAPFSASFVEQVTPSR